MDQDLSKQYLTIENALREMSVEPEQCRGEIPGQWNMAFGDITLGVDVWIVPEQENKKVFQVQCALVTAPQNPSAEFFKTLLEINYILYGVSISMVDQTVYIKSMKGADDLHQSEIIDSIYYCGYYAEHYQKELVQRYGAVAL